VSDRSDAFFGASLRAEDELMGWWTKIVRADGKVEIKDHKGPKPKLSAMITLNFAHNAGGVPHENLGLYKRNPEKYLYEPNLLPAMLAEHEKKRLVKQIREVMKKPPKNP